MLNYRLGPAETQAWGSMSVRISENIKKAVVFFGVTGESGIEYGGTGFLISDVQGGLRLAACRTEV